jgi:hypothetical protein
MIPMMVAVLSRIDDFLAVDLECDFMNKNTTIVNGNSTPKTSGIR